MRFRTKTIVGVALIEAAVLTVLVWVGLGNLQSSNEAEIERRLAIGGRLIVASVRDALIAQDVATLEGIAAEIVGTGDLVYLRVLDDRRRVLAQGGRSPPVDRPEDRSVWQVDDDVYDRELRIQEGGQAFGTVQFGIDVGPVRALVARSRDAGLWISLSGMLLVAAFSYVLGSYLTRQVLRLRDASLAVAGGDLTRDVPEKGDDELAQTAAAFNVMVARLRDAEARRAVEERRRAEDAARLQRQYEELRSLNARLVEQQDALSKAKDAADAASVAKSRFLATMSHEIRTPMNGMLGMAQLLKDPGLSQAERVDHLDTLLESGRLLLTLLNDILDLAKVEAGRFDLVAEAVSPSRLPEEVRRLHATSAADKGLELVAHWEGPSPRVLLDPVRVRQMLGNLVSNAIKFTETGRILINGRAFPAEDGRVVIEFVVADTGVGIPQSERARLFQPFTQVDDSNTRRFGGSGLGLSIVRQLAGLMGGEIRFEPAEGGGSVFRLRLPSMQVSSAEPAVDPSIPKPGSPVDAPASGLVGRVLVAEDNPVNRKLVAAMLRRTGVEPVLAGDGLQAVDVLERGESIELVLMDLHMPVLDGYDATRRIRAGEAERGGRRIPVVALTASAFAENERLCRQAGMDGFLTKPLVYEALVAELARWLPPGASFRPPAPPSAPAPPPGSGS